MITKGDFYNRIKTKFNLFQPDIATDYAIRIENKQMPPYGIVFKNNELLNKLKIYINEL